jgi:hypothetical protein
MSEEDYTHSEWTIGSLSPTSPNRQTEENFQDLSEVSREKVSKFQHDWIEVCTLIKMAHDADEPLTLTPEQNHTLIVALRALRRGNPKG